MPNRLAALVGPLTFVLAATVGPACLLAQDAAPPPPKSLTVQAHVIMASKAQVPHVEDSLKEVAKSLQEQFTGLFNRFRLHQTVSGEVKHEKYITLALVDKYHLKVLYRGASYDPQKKEQKLLVTCTLLKRTQVVIDGQTKDKDEPLGTAMYALPPEKFVLIAGPKVNEETLVVAVRVRK